LQLNNNNHHITDLIFTVVTKTWHIMLIIVTLNLFGTLGGTLS
jgi:hypothetical protein